MESNQCPHILNIDPNWISFQLMTEEFNDARKSNNIKCTDCFHDNDLWVCLMRKCMHIGCGRTNKKHAMEHFQKFQHPLRLNLTKPTIWCYECDDEVFAPEEITDMIKKSAYPKMYQHEIESKEKFKEQNKKKSYDPGVCGLQNLGNTCFMNSVMQCLSNCHPLMKYFTFCESELLGVKSDLVKSFTEFIKEMWSGKNSVIKPTSVLRAISKINPMFIGYDQHDAQEFLRSIVDALHESLKKKVYISSGINQKKNTTGNRYEEKSFISNVFQGHFLCQVTCTVCSNVSSVKEPFYDISLVIPNSSELYKMRNKSNQFWSFLPTFFSEKMELSECFKFFCVNEKLEGKDAYQCEKCKKKTVANRRIMLSDLPEVLCLHLKRFKHNSFFGSKKNDVVEFPLQNFDVSEFVADTRGVDRSNCVYDLIGLVNHSGSLDGGHYIAYCKNNITGKWHEFNDSSTHEVTEEEVLSQEAYLLFYTLQSSKHQEEVNKITTFLKESTTKEEMAYVPKSWFNSWETLKNKDKVGPIENELACPHKLLVPDAIANTESFITVPISVWNFWMENYGGGPLLQTLEVCEICTKEREFLKVKKKEERETLKHLESNNKSSDLCMIDSEWAHNWFVFVWAENNSTPPGPIPNHKLLTNDNSVRTDLVKNKDFRLIRKDVWEYFHSIYGGGPFVPFKSINFSLL